MKWSFCDLKLLSSLIATSKAHTPLGGFCDSARGQSNLELRMVQHFLLLSLRSACRIRFLFHLNATKLFLEF